MKKGLLCLGAAMICAAQAMAYDFMVDGIAYNKLTDTTVEVTFKGANYNSGKDYTDASYVIPPTVSSGGVTYTVTKIGDSAFYGSGVTSVELPETVTVLDNYAFGMCRSLKEINLPSGITSIPDYAFALGNSFALETLTINCDPSKVNAKMFKQTGQIPALKHLILGAYLKELGESAIGYWANGVADVTVAAGDGTLKCDPAAFERWTAGVLNINRPVEMTMTNETRLITEIHIGDLAPFTGITFTSDNYSAAKLYVYGARLNAYKATEPWSNFAQIMAEPGTEVEDRTHGFNFTVNDTDATAELIAAGSEVDPYEGDIVIPETIVKNGKTYTVTSIGYQAFYNRPITSVKFSATIKEVKQSAFNRCTALADVELNDGLEKLGYDVFSNCKSLKSIVIPGTVRNLPGGSSFSGSGLQTVALEEGVETIADDFMECAALDRVFLPSTLKEIGMSAFENCTSLTDIIIPQSVKKINAFAFAGTGIAQISLPEGVEELSGQALGQMNGANQSYSLKSVELPASLKTIHYMTFNNDCGLTELTVNGSGDNLPVGTSPSNANKLLNTPESNSGIAPLEKLFLNRVFVDPKYGDNITAVIFNRKTTLKEVTFGPDLATVPALPACAAITAITIQRAEVPAVYGGNGYHADVYANAVLTVPAGTAAAFRAHEIWGKFAHIEEEAALTAIDASKVRYTVGSGSQKYIFALSFNNAERLDNLVWGVASDNSSLTAQEALDMIAAADKRLKIVADGTVYFDLDGNGVFDIKDAVAAGEGWNAGAKLLAADGTTPVLSMCHGDINVAEAPYYFYVPGPDELGVWVPESMTVKLSDEGFVLPVLVQPQGKTVGNTANWQASSRNTSYALDRKIIITPYTFVDGSYHARPTLVGATGTTYVRYRPQIGGTFTESNYITLKVEAPEVPMTSITLEEPEYTAGLNQAVPINYSYEPANATFTAINATVKDTSIASFTLSAGLKTKTVEGSTTVTVASRYDSNVKAEMALTVELKNPVTNVHFGHGTENGVINVYVRQLIGLKPIVEPANADNPEVTITLSNNGTSKADMTCSTYQVNWWDLNKVMSKFLELSGHRPTGDNPAKLLVKSNDGKFEREFVVNVLESDRTPLEGGYEDGTIILNEEWFGHTNGGLNYITPDDEIIYQAYERENPGMSFGCTSQYGAIWNDKLFVVSKQPADGGDPLPGGGCLVIADAKTMKRIGGSYDRPTFNGITGDGCAVAGATANKIYVTTSNGIYIYDITDVENPVITGRIGQGNDTDLYNGQTGDIINGGKYVFAVMQGGGLMCIDPLTDEVTPIADANIQGVTQTADGTIWYATGAGTGDNVHSVFVALDPETLEEIDRVHMPASIGTVQCSWGAWRSTAFKGDHTTGDLWFVTGAAGVMGGASGDYYRYTPGTDPNGITPFFSLDGVTGINDFGEEVGQMTYGTPIFDPRNNRLVVMTGREGAASGGYRDHWIHFVDGDSQEITKTIKLNAYYWFQSLPILPDKHAAQLREDFERVLVGIKQHGDTGYDLDLKDVVTDPDNHDANIRFSLPEANALAAEQGSVAATLKGSVLNIKPMSSGTTNVLVQAESNGRAATLSVPVTVRQTTGIDDAWADSGEIRIIGNRAYINGYAGREFSVYDMAGTLLTRFTADSDTYVAEFGFESGVYAIVSGDISVKFAIR